MENITNNSVYTMSDWERDHTLKLEVGQVIAPEVYFELRDSVPPTTNHFGYFQPGEAYTHDRQGIQLYMTFKAVKDKYGFYEYIGLKPKIENSINVGTIAEFITNSVNNFINESFASNQLKNIIMKGGGISKQKKYYFDNDGFHPSTYPVGQKYKGLGGNPDDGIQNPLPNILNRLTDADLIYRATHIENYPEILYVTLNNGEQLSIPLTEDEFNKSSWNGMDRTSNSYDDGKEMYNPQKDINRDKLRRQKPGL